MNKKFKMMAIMLFAASAMCISGCTKEDNNNSNISGGNTGGGSNNEQTENTSLVGTKWVHTDSEVVQTIEFNTSSAGRMIVEPKVDYIAYSNDQINYTYSGNKTTGNGTITTYLGSGHNPFTQPFEIYGGEYMEYANCEFRKN